MRFCIRNQKKVCFLSSFFSTDTLSTWIRWNVLCRFFSPTDRICRPLELKSSVERRRAHILYTLIVGRQFWKQKNWFFFYNHLNLLEAKRFGKESEEMRKSCKNKSYEIKSFAIFFSVSWKRMVFCLVYLYVKKRIFLFVELSARINCNSTE